MLTATIQINRPIVAKILKGVALKDRVDGKESTEKTILIPPGQYPFSGKNRQRILHLKQENTRERYHAFLDDFKELRGSGAIEILNIFRKGGAQSL